MKGRIGGRNGDEEGKGRMKGEEDRKYEVSGKGTTLVLFWYKIILISSELIVLSNQILLILENLI